MLVTQAAYKENGKLVWCPTVTVFYVADPPTEHVQPAKVGLPDIPAKWEPVEGVKSVLPGPEELKRVKSLMGDQGLVGVWLTGTNPFRCEEDLFNYFDNPDKHEQWGMSVWKLEKRFKQIMALEEKPDFYVSRFRHLIFRRLRYSVSWLCLLETRHRARCFQGFYTHVILVILRRSSLK